MACIFCTNIVKKISYEKALFFDKLAIKLKIGDRGKVIYKIGKYPQKG